MFVHLYLVDYTLVQWLRFWTVTQMGVGSNPGRGHLFVKKKVFSVISSSGFDGTKCAFCSQYELKPFLVVS